MAKVKEYKGVLFWREGDIVIALYGGIKLRIIGDPKKGLQYISSHDIWELMTERYHFIPDPNSNSLDEGTSIEVLS